MEIKVSMYEPEEQPKQVTSSSIIAPIKQLRKHKSTVFLAYDTSTDKKFVMKIYNFEGGKSSPGFIRESRVFGTLSPHLIKITETQDNLQNLKMEHFSCTIMEYAKHGDLSELMSKHKIWNDKKLVRTIFHQIATGIDHLHGRGISHLDLKLTNIHIGSEYKIKIAGFDQCHFNSENPVLATGTNHFRAPEIKKGQCANPRAADVYSLGIILFNLVNGHRPYDEDKVVNVFKLEHLLWDNDPVFWKVNSLYYQTQGIKDEDFKKLIFGMCKKNPDERISVYEVMHSAWYKGETYSEKEYREIMKDLIKSSRKH